MNIADDSDWRSHVDNVALSHQQLFRLGANGLDDGLGEEFFFVQPRDALVQVDRRWRLKSAGELNRL